MNCPGCDRPNQPHRRYCGGCGAPLLAHCPSCGFENEPVDRFCGGCGAGLAARSDAHAAPLATPPAQPAVRRGPTAAVGDELLSARDVSELMRKPESAPATPSLPARVTQDDLDRLFGAKP